MLFSPTQIPQLTEIRIERHADARGSFGRVFDRDAFAAHGLPTSYAQASSSVTRRAGTIRAMHYQRAPFGETKLVRCVRGAIHDVVADLRPESPSFLRWQAFRLGAEGDSYLCIPPGCAHGFQTLTEDCEVIYQMDVPFTPEAATGFRYDDPAFGIEWPLPVTVISDKDLAWAPFSAPPPA